MKHTREQHDGKFVKSPERKSPRTAHKTNTKISTLYKEEFKERVTAEGEEMNVEIVTMDVNKLEHLQDLLTQTGQKNEQPKSDIKNID